ncbi:hypothetical protein CRUP_031320 [Coryphaenoides rupestris]|nr:hypothetical protein CRUP_031320 [Coryphaenoides rupestris]
MRAKQRVMLVFDGIDTISSISLNGVVLGETDNMFRQYDFSVGPVLTEGDNVLAVSLASPVRYAAQRSEAHGYRVPPDCPPLVQQGQCHVNYIRKEQSSFSWDWGPSFPTAGLWQGVRLEAYDALRLVHLSTVPVYNQTSSGWSLRVELEVEAVAEVTRGQVTLSLPGLDSQQTFLARFLAGRTRNAYTLHINAGVRGVGQVVVDARLQQHLLVALGVVLAVGGEPAVPGPILLHRHLHHEDHRDTQVEKEGQDWKPYSEANRVRGKAVQSQQSWGSLATQPCRSDASPLVGLDTRKGRLGSSCRHNHRRRRKMKFDR